MSEHDPGWFTHDEMCWFNPSLPSIRPCICGLLASVRADERERIAQAIETYPVWIVGRHIAARIARNGGRDEG